MHSLVSLIEKIEIPTEVNFEVSGKTITLKNSNGVISKKFNNHALNFDKQGNTLIVTATPSNRKNKALLGTVFAHLKNMVEALEYGFNYKMSIVFSHFPMTVKVNGKIVEINNFTGQKALIRAKILGNTKVEIKGKEVFVSGYNKEDVAQTAANLETATRVRNKDVRIYQDGIYVISKDNIKEKKEEVVLNATTEEVEQ